MRKKVLFTALLSAVLLVGCNGYSKVNAEKAREVQAENLKKEITYTKAVSTTVVSKLDIKIKNDNMTSTMKDAAISATKLVLFTTFGVKDVNEKDEKEMTSAIEIGAYRLPAVFAEVEGKTYYTSGSKIKIVQEDKDDALGLNSKKVTLINEYGFVTSTTRDLSGDMEVKGTTASIKLSYKQTIKYTK